MTAPSPARAAPDSSGRGFYFGVEIGNDVLERGDRLLHGGNLHQFPAVDRAVAVLQRDDQIPPLLLELNQRQTMIRQMFHDGVPALRVCYPFNRAASSYSSPVLPSLYKTPANFSDRCNTPAQPPRRSVNNW